MREVELEFGINAGKLWRALDSRGSLTKNQLMKHTNLKTDEFNGAVGWLAKENKIRRDGEFYKLDQTNLNIKIEEDAGMIWNLLDTKKCNMNNLSKITQLDEEDVQIALGWLARDGKLDKICHRTDIDSISSEKNEIGNLKEEINSLKSDLDTRNMIIKEITEQLTNKQTQFIENTVAVGIQNLELDQMKNKLMDNTNEINSTQLEIFYCLENVPVHSVRLLASREEALDYPSGDITLVICHDCGFIANIMYNPALQDYSFSYEATQAYSSTFNAFHRKLAERLIEKYNLYHKTILEIGCGQGEFLSMLCDLGHNQGFGFDPAYSSDRSTVQAHENVHFIKDFYSEKYADYPADFICCKMTLEHISHPAEFVSMVRKSIGDRENITVFFQVPDVMRILKEAAFWDIYYEHCSYFSQESLSRLFSICGFETLSIEREYDNQYLLIDAKPINEQLPLQDVKKDGVGEILKEALNFKQTIQSILIDWHHKLEQIHSVVV